MKALSWWPQLEASCGGRVALVDGDAMFNRPGPRLVDAYEWLVATLQATRLPHLILLPLHPSATCSSPPPCTHTHATTPTLSLSPSLSPAPTLALALTLISDPVRLQTLPHAAPPDFPVEWVAIGSRAAAAAESASDRVQRLRAELAAAEAELVAEEQGVVAAIEEVHLCAVRQGHHSYKDPKTGDNPC